MAEQLIPRLARNIVALPTNMMLEIIQSTRLVQGVTIFNPEYLRPADWDWILPDEDVSHAVTERYINPAHAKSTFEMIWARWDMTAVHKEQPVIADVVVSNSVLDNLRMRFTKTKSLESPDWWRQIAASAFDDEGNLLAVACNTHMPNEYETYIFGDPRLNVDAGQKGKYVSLHSERAVVALCAKYGLTLKGAFLYVTTFPCEDCAREIAFAGVKRVFFQEGYSVLNAQEVLRSNGVEIVQVVEEPGSAQ
ncbi:MAG: deaminase [Minisyncoccia bacterium]